MREVHELDFHNCRPGYLQNIYKTLSSLGSFRMSFSPYNKSQQYAIALKKNSLNLYPILDLWY